MRFFGTTGILLVFIMKIYEVKTRPAPVSNYKEVYQKAFGLYNAIRKKTKRRPYVRSTYFNKQKIFLQLFWNHLREKNFRDRTRRAKFFPCAIDLIQHSRYEPATNQTKERPSELLHRFAGKTKDGQRFFVQIKEELRTGEKWLVSVFPED